MVDFIPVLIAAVLLFAVLMLAFGDWIMTSPSYQYVYNGSAINYTSTVRLGEDFNISSGRGPTQVTYMTGIVSQGILSSLKKQYSFDAETVSALSGARLDLEVTNTNLYGPLVIKMNGNTVYSNYTRIGSHTIYLPKEYLEPKNYIEITAGSSGWRLWAPTVYIFRANTSIDYFGDMKREFKFSMSESQYDTILDAKLVANLTEYEGKGRPIYTVNDYEVYRGTNRDIDMPPEILVQGENKVTVSSESGAYFSMGTLDAVFAYK